MKKIFSALALSFQIAAFGYARTELVTVDLSRRTSPVNWTWTADADSAVRVTVKSDGSDFDLREWGAYLFVGDANLATDIPGSNASFNHFTFDVTRQYLPTNGKYTVQIIATNATGRVEEWARGNVTVRANPAIEAMPATWNGYVYLASRIAPLVTRQLVIEEVAATTTVMKAELKDYVDEQVEATGVVTPQSVTNAASSIITNHVASGYLCTKEFLISATGDIYNDAVNDAGVKVPEIVTRQYIKDLTFLDGFTDYTTGGKTYRKTTGNIYFDGANIKVSDGKTPALVTTLGSLVTASTASINGQPLTYGGNIVISTSSIGAVPNTRKVNGQPLTSDITIESMPDNGLVLTNNAVKTKSGTTITAAHVGAASAAAVQGKADASTVYTKTEADNAFLEKNSIANAAWKTTGMGSDLSFIQAGVEERLVLHNHDPETETPYRYVAFEDNTAPKLTGRVYDFDHGSNFTMRIYAALTNVIQTLGGSVTNVPSF